MKNKLEYKKWNPGTTLAVATAWKHNKVCNTRFCSNKGTQGQGNYTGGMCNKNNRPAHICSGPLSKLCHLAMASGRSSHVWGWVKLKPYWQVRWPRCLDICDGHCSCIFRNLLHDYTSLISPNINRMNFHDRWKGKHGENVHCRRRIWFVAAISWSPGTLLVQLKLRGIFFFTFIYALKDNSRLFLAPWLVTVREVPLILCYDEAPQTALEI